MGNITGSLAGAALGVRMGGRVGLFIGSLSGCVFGAMVEIGHIIVAKHRHRGRYEVQREVIQFRKWEIVELGVRYCPLNVAPGPMNFLIDCMRHVFAPFGAWRSGVMRHDWVVGRVRGPRGEQAFMVAKKCCDGNIVLAWCKNIREADFAGIDIVKGCKASVFKTWHRISQKRGRRVRDMLRKVLLMTPSYNCIVDNCQDFARELLTWHEKC